MTAQRTHISDKGSDSNPNVTSSDTLDFCGITRSDCPACNCSRLSVSSGLRLCVFLFVMIVVVLFFTFSEISGAALHSEASSFDSFDTPIPHFRAKHHIPRYLKYSGDIWRRPAPAFSIISSLMYRESIKQFIRERFNSVLLLRDYTALAENPVLIKELSSRQILSYRIPVLASFSANFDIRTEQSLSQRGQSSSRTDQSPSSATSASTAVCMFTGDIMCLRGQQYEAETAEGFDFWPSYSLVAGIFKTADLVCGNLETLVSDSNPTTMQQKLADNGSPQCNAPDAILDTLKKAGFDAFVTANNHTCDWGPSGIIETKDKLDRAGFANVGTHTDSDSGRFCIFDVNGIKVALLAYTQFMNQRTSTMEPDELTRMVHLHKMDDIERDIADAKAAGADFVAVYLHWGNENTEELTKTQLIAPIDIAEAGADLILGSHPHCLQSCRYIDTSDGRRVLCMHSLGNFCSSMERVEANKYTLILRIELVRTASAVAPRESSSEAGISSSGENNSSGSDASHTIVASASYIPCRIMPYGSRYFAVVPVDPALNGGYTSGMLTDAREHINDIIGGVIPEYSPE